MRRAARRSGAIGAGRHAVRLTAAIPAVRPPAVAGSFYPADRADLDRLIDGCLVDAGRVGRPEAEPDRSPATLLGLLVPHAGLVYSGAVAAAAWRHIAPDPAPSIVLLGTNHRAGWLDGVGAWEAGAWSTPLGAVPVDEALAAAIVALGPPFAIDRAAHLGEHSIEVQLPFVRRLAAEARIVPLAVSVGTGTRAIEAGTRLGALLAERRAAGEPVLLAISSDAAHYPPAWLGEAVNERLAPAIEGVDAARAAATEAAVVAEGGPGLVCGMCGIEPTVLGLAALRGMGVTGGRIVAAATSADVGAGRDRTVGYLGATFGL